MYNYVVPDYQIKSKPAEDVHVDLEADADLCEMLTQLHETHNAEAEPPLPQPKLNVEFAPVLPRPPKRSSQGM